MASLAENIKRLALSPSPLNIIFEKNPQHCSKRVGEVNAGVFYLTCCSFGSGPRRDEIKHELKRLHSAPLLADIQSHLSSHWLQERKTDTVSFPFDNPFNVI